MPPDFTRRVEAKTGPEVGLFVDNTDQISSGTLNDAVAQAVASVNVPFVAIRPDRSQVNTRRVELYRLVDYDQTLVPGVVVMAIFMGTMITGVFNLVMDRFLGVDEAILMTPITKADIVVGLIVSGFIITLCMALMVLTASALITGLPVTRTFLSSAGCLCRALADYARAALDDVPDAWAGEPPQDSRRVLRVYERDILLPVGGGIPDRELPRLATGVCEGKPGILCRPRPEIVAFQGQPYFCYLRRPHFSAIIYRGHDDTRGHYV